MSVIDVPPPAAPGRSGRGYAVFPVVVSTIASPHARRSTPS